MCYNYIAVKCKYHKRSYIMRSPPTKPEEFYNSFYNSQQLSVHDASLFRWHDKFLFRHRITKQTQHQELLQLLGEQYIPLVSTSSISEVAERLKGDWRLYLDFDAVRKNNQHFIHTLNEVRRISIEICQKLFADYQYLIAVHTNTFHLHSHIVINSVSVKGDKYVYLNACITYAVNSRQLDYNPCKPVNIQRKQFPDKSIRHLSEKEISAFIQAANTQFDNGIHRFKNRGLLLLDIYTGLRVGELCALKWSDVDFEAAMLNVCKNVVTTYNFTNNDNKRRKKINLVQNSTKSQNRVVPLNKTALALLQEMYSNANDKTGYIAGGKNPGNVSSLIRSYERICKLAGIPNCKGVHTLRHTFASRLFSKGADIKVISEVLGHTDIGFTYNTYIHLAENQTKNALKLLDD